MFMDRKTMSRCKFFPTLIQRFSTIQLKFLASYFVVNSKINLKFIWKGKYTQQPTQHLWFCCSVAQSCPTLCGPMDCSMPDLPILHHLLEFAQIHIHCIGDAIQPSHPLTPSSSALNLSQHQRLFQSVGCLPLGDQNTGASALASALPMSIQG